MKVLAHAKLNLFLFVKNRRDDGFHNIRTGVTFLDLHDEVTIKRSNKNSIKYSGHFSPSGENFKSDIVKKTLNFLSKEYNNKFFFNIKIKKNIPYGAGLGGGSSNAAAIIRTIINLKKTNINYKKISSIGADVPMCIKSKDCIANGIGEKLNFNIRFPKYYFVLIKPNFTINTKQIYSKIINKNKIYKKQNYTNDLEKIVINLHPEIKKILKTLSKFQNKNFFNMTGSGSCCYVAFKNKKYARSAMLILKKTYPRFWVYLAKN